MHKIAHVSASHGAIVWVSAKVHELNSWFPTCVIMNVEGNSKRRDIVQGISSQGVLLERIMGSLPT